MAEPVSGSLELRQRTVPAAPDLVEPLHDAWVRCWACGHACKIPPGRAGICQVRFNDAGTLRVPHGYVAALACDPIEKKPFFHALPGSTALSFGMLGCDLHCGYCQNWETSQAIRDPQALAPPVPISAEAIVARALALGAPTVASTYNEPLITSEWAVDVFRQAKQHGLRTAFISNGNGTDRVLAYLRPWVDFYKVDLKSFRDKNYRQLGGRLDRILDTIPKLVQSGFWVEIVTLVIPGFNDSDEELGDIAAFLAGISPDIPWHVTAFHKDYRMTDPDDTPVATLLRAWDIGRNAGLNFVYAGNRPGRVGDRESTRCAGCGAMLVERVGYLVRQNRLRGNHCPDCGVLVPGPWEG